MVGNSKSGGHKVSREYGSVSSESSGEASHHLEWRSSPGESIYKNLELELAKPFNPNRREIRIPEYRRGVKDPNTTQWRRGSVRHTAMLVKVLQWLHSTSAKEVERGIPTGSRLWYQLVTPPIQSYTNHTRKRVRSRSGTHGKISQHNSKNINKSYKHHNTSQGPRGRLNTSARS